MQNPQNTRRWKDTRAAAEYLGCSTSLLNSDRVTGLHKIPFCRLGKKILYDTEDLDRYLEGCKVRWDGAA